MDINIDALRLLGDEWNTGNHHRIYFDKIIGELVGLEINRYKTGDISGAWVNGQVISNTRANRLVPPHSKLWFDVKTGEFHSKGLSRGIADLAIQKLHSLATEFSRWAN